LALKQANLGLSNISPQLTKALSAKIKLHTTISESFRLVHISHIWPLNAPDFPKNESEWPLMGQIRDLFRLDSVHLGSESKNILKSDRKVPSVANPTDFGPKSHIPFWQLTLQKIAI